MQHDATMTSDWNGPQQQPPPQQYRQQYPPPPSPQQQYLQQNPQQNPPATKSKMPGWAIALMVLTVLNLLMAAYLVFFVVQAQVALSQLQDAFETGFSGGLGG